MALRPTTSSVSIAIMDGSVVRLHNDCTTGALKAFKTCVETVCEQVTREGYVHKGQIELANLAAQNCSTAIKGSVTLRQGGSWTHLKKKAGVPSEHDDSMKQSFTELEKDAQACRLLIRRLRVGQASEEAVKDLTSLKVTASEMGNNYSQFLVTEAKTTLPIMTKDMVAEEMTSLDMGVMHELPPKSLALLLVSVSHEMQQQLLAEATSLGVLRKMRLVVVMNGVHRSYDRMQALRRKYHKQLQELHKRGVQPKPQHGKGEAPGSPSKWRPGSIFTSCWQGGKYLKTSFSKQGSFTSQNSLSKQSADLIKAVTTSQSGAESPQQPQQAPKQQPADSPSGAAASSSSASITSIDSTFTAASLAESPAVTSPSPIAKDMSTKALVAGADSSAAVASGGKLHETISATMDQLRQQLRRSSSTSNEASAHTSSSGAKGAAPEIAAAADK